MYTTMNKRIGFLLLYVFAAVAVHAQTVLAVKEAVEIALENNYEIRLAQSDLTVASTNVTYGNAGMLPAVTGNFSQSNSSQNSKQTQATGEVRELDNAKNNNMTYGVSLGWTIFDGLGMFSRYNKLKDLEKQGDVQLKGVILNTVSQVITLYYTIVEQQKMLQAIDTNIVLSQERLRMAENRFSIGKASKLEVLNVQVNLNADISTRLRQIEVLRNLKINLNSVLARDLLLDFKVDDDVSYNKEMVYVELLELAKHQNPTLQLAAINKHLAELDVKTVKANRYPTLRLNTGYNFSRSESSLGFVASSNARGLNYGLTASLTIFDGFNQRRNEKVAKIAVDQADLLIEQQELQIKTAITTAFQTYKTNLDLANLEESNEQIAKQNLAITLDKYKIGTISTIEFRDAQENFINAVARYNSALLQAKLSEVKLKELVGNIQL